MKPVFRLRPAPHWPVDEGTDAEVVNRPRRCDEVFRLPVVDESISFIELGDVAAVSGVDTVGVVEGQHAVHLLFEYPRIAIVR
nr:hypothetical protein [Haladaptatus cibarius]